MPYYDYSKKNDQKDVSKVSGSQLTATTTRFENERRPIQPVFQYVKPPPKITPTTKVIMTQPPPPPPPPITTIITHLPPPKSTIGTNTDYVPKASVGTAIDKDLLRMHTKAVNTDLRWDQLDLKQPRPKKLNHFWEGFRSYYDEEADVLGVMCCICCAPAWNRCNNMCKGCRNVVSCPVYCWILIIVPFFICLCLAILFTGMVGGRVIG